MRGDVIAVLIADTLPANGSPSFISAVGMNDSMRAKSCPLSETS